ncbi:hypothetical protein BDR07DRAFT_399242 [Suillus spraguei]|nr:hypothetical protein BDR07DRAFT_399242 [Suillus spraguei]
METLWAGCSLYSFFRLALSRSMPKSLPTHFIQPLSLHASDLDFESLSLYPMYMRIGFFHYLHSRAFTISLVRFRFSVQSAGVFSSLSFDDKQPH